MIAIVDYGMGNLASVYKALKYLHYDAVITNDPAIIRSSDGLILPGVGAFAPAMEALQRSGLDEAVKNFAESGKPLLGICLGMQLLFDSSDEGAKGGEPIKGLGLIPGRVVRFPDFLLEKGLKIPQIGWNKLSDCTGSILRENDFVYFVHSFYCVPENKEDCAARTDYEIKYCAAVERGNIFATQFHPEKSGEAGLQILERFARRVKS